MWLEEGVCGRNGDGQRWGKSYAMDILIKLVNWGKKYANEDHIFHAKTYFSFSQQWPQDFSIAVVHLFTLSLSRQNHMCGRSGWNQSNSSWLLEVKGGWSQGLLAAPSIGFYPAFSLLHLSSTFSKQNFFSTIPYSQPRNSLMTNLRTYSLLQLKSPSF